MTEICHAGRATAKPCTNTAEVEHAKSGAPLCASHARVLELGEEAGAWLVVESLLVEAITQAMEAGLGGEPLSLLTRARLQAAEEAHSLEVEMTSITPERG